MDSLNGMDFILAGIAAFILLSGLVMLASGTWAARDK
jgi:hypothetical protein